MKPFFKWLGIVLLALILLLLLAASGLLGWMKWAGDRNWKRVQAELHAKGEKLTFAELIPPAPPDDQNFFADPLWMQLADLVEVKNKNKDGVEVTSWEPRLPADQRLINQWKTLLTDGEKERISALQLKCDHEVLNDRVHAIISLGWEVPKTTDPARRKLIAQLILDLLQPAAPMLAKITDLSKRPSAYFPIRYQDGFAAPLPQITVLLKIAQLYQAKANAELALGDTAVAASDIQSLLRIVNKQENVPVLITHLVRIAILTIGRQSIDYGIDQHQWTAAQLTDFQSSLQSTDLNEALHSSLRGERVFFNSFNSLSLSEAMNIKNPYLAAGLQVFYVYEQGYYNNMIQNGIESCKMGYPINSATSPFTKKIKTLQADPITRPLHLLELMVLPSLDTTVEKTIETQTQVSQTIIACALERYRIAHGSYPASLDSLIPDYLATIPKEPTTGNPMNYRMETDRKFLLWAPGWNLQTLGGKIGEFKGEGDIVWNQKLPSSAR